MAGKEQIVSLKQVNSSQVQTKPDETRSDQEVQASLNQKEDGARNRPDQENRRDQTGGYYAKTYFVTTNTIMQSN